MPTFILTPNQRILSRYLTNATDAEFDAEYPDYIPQSTENIVEWSVFDNEVAFEKDFKELLAKYNLIEHYDNLLYLTLYTFDSAWQGIQWAYDDYQSKKRARELAKLLLLLKQTAPGKLCGIGFSSLMDTAKTTDPLLNDWISKTLENAIESKSFPIGAFGDNVLQMLTDKHNPLEPEPANIDKLKRYASKRLVNPKNQITKGKATICLSIYHYLQGETNLKASENTIFSDAQLNFLFKLLQLLKQVDEQNIDSEPKDYMRTLLMNYLKP
jgi:hypothetical protein